MEGDDVWVGGDGGKKGDLGVDLTTEFGVCGGIGKTFDGVANGSGGGGVGSGGVEVGETTLGKDGAKTDGVIWKG